MVTHQNCAPTGAEQRLRELGIKLPAPPEPFGTYAEAVQTGNLLFLTGMLPTVGRTAKFIGRVGAELDLEAGRNAAHLAALNAVSVAREHLGTLDRVRRIVRLGVAVAASGDMQDHAKVADGGVRIASGFFRSREESLPTRIWRCEPSARRTGRAGTDFRSRGLGRLYHVTVFAKLKTDQSVC